MNRKDEIVPRDKANAILDFWRNFGKMAENNSKVDEINKSSNEDDDVDTREPKRRKRTTQDIACDKQLTKKSKLETETDQMVPKSGDNRKLYKLFEQNKKIALKKATKTDDTKNYGTKISSVPMVVDDSGSQVLEVLLKDGTRRKICDVFEDKLQTGHSGTRSLAIPKANKSSPQTTGDQQKHKLPKGVTKKLLEDFVENKTADTSTNNCPVLVTPEQVQWKEIKQEDMNLDYGIIFAKSVADDIYEQLERDTEYYTGDLEKVRVFGKWHKIPRKQVAYGDDGLSYRFSGNCLPARPWTTLLSNIRNTIEKLTGFSFNFVLINRYKDGFDTIGEHRDDEKDLLPDHPIASLSLGQQRDFVFRHSSARKKATSGQQHPPTVTLALEHGSLLLMKPPTNTHWYHSLPVRKNAINPRLNLTFRRMVIKK